MMRYILIAAVLALWTTSSMPIEAHELVDIRSVNPRIQLDPENLNNCTFVIKDIAVRLGRVQQDLEKDCIGLYVLCAYYPHPGLSELEDHHDYDDDIYDRFGHHRGTAVDVRLVYQNGSPLEMPSVYGKEICYRDRNPFSLDAHVYHNNYRLEEAMLRHGFVRQKDEAWWHFDFKFWRNYPILDAPVECGCGACDISDQEYSSI